MDAVRKQNMDDVAIITGVAGKDQAALVELSNRYGRSIFGVAYRMGLSVEDSEEIVQEWLVKIWLKAEQWSESHGSGVKAWLYRIAVNLVIDFKRKEKRTPVMGASDVDEMPISGEDRTDQSTWEHEVSEVVLESMKKLPESQRQALILSYYEQMSHAEVAEAIGGSVKSVESLLARARKGMKGFLEKRKDGLL